MKGSCHCGAVTLEVPGPPEFLNQCNCSACWKLGTLWGYYPVEALTTTGAPAAYRRADEPDPSIDFNFCARCGAVTHWSPIDRERIGRTGVNMRLFEPEPLGALEVRYGDRRNHPAGEQRQSVRDPAPFREVGPVA